MKRICSIFLWGALVSLPDLAGAQSLQITNPPANLAVRSGEVAIFRVAATGSGPLTFTWFKDGLPLRDHERISGVCSPQLSLCPVVAADAGNYTVSVSDGVQTITSLPATLAVDVTLPVFTSLPTEVHIARGQSVVFSAEATGSPPVAYVWQRDGVVVTDNDRIVGAPTSTLTIANASPDDSGWYALRAGNAAGWVSSKPARLYVHTASTLATAAGFDAGDWSTGGDAVWVGQSEFSLDGSALSSQPIGHNQMTYIETAVYGPGDLEFSWKVSSEGPDLLRFLVNGQPWDRISGEVDWTSRKFHVPSGRQVLRWQYSKDGSVVQGLDRGLVDKVAFMPTPQVSLEDALPGCPLPIATSGYDRWFGQSLITSDGGGAVRSGYLPDNQWAAIETRVSGPGAISFDWRISSESPDVLHFLVDGVAWAGISGQVEWTNRVFHIPWGQHTLVWRYRKDGSIAQGSDAAWLDQVRYVPVRMFDLAEASDALDSSWVSGGETPWFGQNETTADRSDALQSGPIGDGQVSWVESVFPGPGTLTFQWRVSSEHADPLRLLVNSNEWARIFGEVDWTSVTNVLRPGDNRVTWQFFKDLSVARGADAGWVDEVSFRPAPPLPHAVNAPHLTWTSIGPAGWFSEMVTTHDGVASARSGDITHNQSTILQTVVVGPGEGSFYWKVSAEGSDPLRFLIDGVEQSRISGVREWERQAFSVPAGSHTLAWVYQKDHSVNQGQDAAWVDQFVFSGTSFSIAQPALVGTGFTVTVPTAVGQSYFLEFKQRLDEPEWKVLNGLPGTGFPLLLTDPAATNAQGFYRVRVQ